jgi:hypothetical protein
MVSAFILPDAKTAKDWFKLMMTVLTKMGNKQLNGETPGKSNRTPDKI